jgi:ferredoxin
MSASTVYDDLVEHLNSMPIGAPKTPELIEILETIFTEEEAGLAIKLPFLPMTLEGLVDRTGVEKDKLEGMLEGMADKGTAAVETLRDQKMYRLLPTIVGFSETPFWAGKRTPQTEKPAKLWRDYARNAFLHEVGGLSDTPMTRVIPMEESLTDPRKVADYERVADKCIGCGVCYPTCSTESITLIPRPEEEQKPVLPMEELVMKVMGDKEREFKF